MISASYVLELYELMSKILNYGFRRCFSYGSIERNISNSELFRHLENGDDSFFYENGLNDYIEDIYFSDMNVLSAPMEKEPDSVTEWLGEAYMRLFFKFHKPMSYIFLYFPLEDMFEYFVIYHEMDWSQLFNLFAKKTNETSLLNKLIKEKECSQNKLSVLTGISLSTIKYYASDDKHLYEAKFENIFKIAYVLKANINIFSREIFNQINMDSYLIEKHNIKYRLYLGINILSYFSPKYKLSDYFFNEKENLLVKEDETISVLFTQEDYLVPKYSFDDVIALLKNYSDPIPFKQKINQIVLIYDYNKRNEASFKPFKNLANKFGFKAIYLINREYVTSSQNDGRYYTSFMSESVYQLLVKNTKDYLRIE